MGGLVKSVRRSVLIGQKCQQDWMKSVCKSGLGWLSMSAEVGGIGQ